jgi:hypothetical protein
MDIDIDFADRKKILELIDHRIASRIEDNELKAHATGVYLQDQDVRTPDLICVTPYDVKIKGRFKIDFLNASVYEGIKSPDHLDQLSKTEPLWELLEQSEFVELLFHVRGHSKLITKLKPTSIPQLAAALAIIRPAKRYLEDKSWDEIMEKVWLKENDQYQFKKSHAHAYALAVVCQMNLICESISYGYN